MKPPTAFRQTVAVDFRRFYTRNEVVMLTTRRKGYVPFFDGTQPIAPALRRPHLEPDQPCPLAANLGVSRRHFHRVKVAEPLTPIPSTHSTATVSALH
jgi:hypothetical protein